MPLAAAFSYAEEGVPYGEHKEKIMRYCVDFWLLGKTKYFHQNTA